MYSLHSTTTTTKQTPILTLLHSDLSSWYECDNIIVFKKAQNHFTLKLHSYFECTLRQQQ